MDNEWFNALDALDALRAINAEWDQQIDLHQEYLSNLFEQFGDEDMFLILEDMMQHLDAYICANPLSFSAPDFHETVRDVLHEYFEGTQAFEFSAAMDLEADALCRFCEAMYFKCINPAIHQFNHSLFLRTVFFLHNTNGVLDNPPVTIRFFHLRTNNGGFRPNIHNFSHGLFAEKGHIPRQNKDL